MNVSENGPSYRSRRYLLALAYASFVSLGLPDGLIGIAWPSIRADFDLGVNGLGALFLATTTGYVVSSVAASRLTARLGVGGLLALSATVSAISLLGYALAPGWATMLACGLLLGSGGGAIDAALNAHAAAHYSARTVNLLHAFYGAGTTAGPLVMTTVLMVPLSWRTGYALVAASQLLLALCFTLTRGAWPVSIARREAAASRPPLLDTIRVRRVKPALFVFFVYVGLESAAGAWIYSVLHEGREFAMESAGLAVSLYWGGLLAGRLAYAILPLRSTPDAVLSGCMAAAAVAVTTVALGTDQDVTLVAVLALGLASGPVFPSLIATTPDRVGQAHAANAVGLQVGVSAAGVAVFPACSGLIAGTWGASVLPLAFTGAWLALLAMHACLLPARSPRKAGDGQVSAASHLDLLSCAEHGENAVEVVGLEETFQPAGHVGILCPHVVEAVSERRHVPDPR